MGPWCTHVLADYGADVMLVEGPAGDIMRRAGAARNTGMGAPFMAGARGKRSIVLDLKIEAARDALLALVATADVFVHNVRRAAMERLRLDYAAVARANPRIVYASLVGYGSNGPYAARPAYDDLIQGAAGLAATFAMALGTAMTTGALAVAAVFAKDTAMRLSGAGSSRALLVGRLVEFAAAACVLLFGVALLAAALSGVHAGG